MSAIPPRFETGLGRTELITDAISRTSASEQWRLDRDKQSLCDRANSHLQVLCPAGRIKIVFEMCTNVHLAYKQDMYKQSKIFWKLIILYSLGVLSFNCCFTYLFLNILHWTHLIFSCVCVGRNAVPSCTGVNTELLELLWSHSTATENNLALHLQKLYS